MVMLPHQGTPETTAMTMTMTMTKVVGLRTRRTIRTVRKFRTVVATPFSPRKSYSMPSPRTATCVPTPHGLNNPARRPDRTEDRVHCQHDCEGTQSGRCEDASTSGSRLGSSIVILTNNRCCDDRLNSPRFCPHRIVLKRLRALVKAAISAGVQSATRSAIDVRCGSTARARNKRPRSVRVSPWPREAPAAPAEQCSISPSSTRAFT